MVRRWKIRSYQEVSSGPYCRLVWLAHTQVAWVYRRHLWSWFTW